jgi:biopolymer transport protein ExbD
MKKDKFTTINVIPFIDIILVLLVIVLTTATFIAQGKIKLNLPQSHNQTTAKDDNKMVVNITKSGEFFIEDKRVNNLKEAFKNLKNSTLVIIRSDKDTKFEYFVQVVDVLKGYNHTKIAIGTKNDSN